MLLAMFWCGTGSADTADTEGGAKYILTGIKNLCADGWDDYTVFLTNDTERYEWKDAVPEIWEINWFIMIDPMYSDPDHSWDSVINRKPEVGQTVYFNLELYTLKENADLDCSQVTIADIDVYLHGYELEVLGYEGDNHGFVITCKATRKPDVFDHVYYDVNGGTEIPFEYWSKVHKVYHNERYAINDPVTFVPPEGYEFDGWKIGDSYYQPGDIIIITEDTTIIAQWSRRYSVQFNPSGGTGAMPTDSVLSGKEITLPACTFTPPGEGYEFYRWKRDDGAYFYPGDSVTITGTTTFFAQWRKMHFNIAYSPNGGTGDMAGRLVSYGEKLRLPACEFTPPTGKVFDQWDLGLPGEVVTITENKTIKAQWKDQYFKVRFESVLGGIWGYSVKYGGTVTAPTPNVPAGDWNFLGWYADQDYTIPYNASAPVTADITYYAKWNRDIWHTVEFNYKKLENQYRSVRVPDGSPVTEPETPVYNAGDGTGYFSFAGWYTNYACTDGNEYDFSRPVTNDITLYAKWIVIPYIKWTGGSASGDGYYVSGGKYYPNLWDTEFTWNTDAPDESQYTWNWSCFYTDEDCTVPLTVEPEHRTDYYMYLILGNTDEDYVGISWTSGYGYFWDQFPVSLEGFIVTRETTSSNYSSDHSHTVSLKMVHKARLKEEYTVSFDMNGKGGIYYAESVTEGQTAFDPGIPEVDSEWIFTGWYSDEDCTEAYDFTSVITADTTVFAGWEDAYVSGTCGTTVSWQLNRKTGMLTIYGTGAMTNFTGSNPSPFKNNTGIKTLVVKEGVTGIGDDAFYGCTGLTNAVLPSTLKSIGSWAFHQCAMSYIGLPDGLTSIGGAAFNSCPNLQEVMIPDTVTRMNDSIFMQCTNLTNVTLPDTLVSIGNHAFYSCISLQYIHIPESVTSIGSKAFYNCTSLSVISIPASVSSIGGSAFYFCSNLQEVTIYNASAGIGSSAFVNSNGKPVMYSWTGSTAETYAAENDITFVSMGSISGTCGENATWTLDPATWTLTISGNGYINDYPTMSNMPWYDVHKYIRSAVISEGIEGIGSGAFRECTSLTSVSLPTTLTRIRPHAFRDTGLTGIQIPDSVSNIESFAFENCTNLTGELVMPAGLTAIGNQAFYNCSQITGVSIPASVQNMGYWAFRFCSSLTEVTIHNPYLSIGEISFANTSENLVIRGWPGSTAEAYAVSNTVRFEPFAVPESAFYLPSALTTIEEDAFSGVAAEAVVIPRNVTSITGNPFAGSSVHVIYGYADSAAEAFAAANEYYFIMIDDE